MQHVVPWLVPWRGFPHTGECDPLTSARSAIFRVVQAVWVA